MKNNHYILELEDSRLDGEKKGNRKDTSLYIAAIDKLQHEKLQTFSLGTYRPRDVTGKEIIWYQGGDVRSYYKNYVTENAYFFTSHYIGFYSTIIQTNGQNQRVSIAIRPRFGYGSKFFNYLLSYAYGLYSPEYGESGNSANSSNFFWIMAFMWKALMEKALSCSHIPKEYKVIEKNERFFRGSLNVGKQIKYNLVDKSLFYCKYKKITMDIPVNRAIRKAYRILSNNGCSQILKGLQSFDNKLASFGVDDEISIHELDTINYSRLNIGYKPVIELSKAIFTKKLFASDIHSLSNISCSYFIDLAELWEAYLLKLIKKHLEGYQVYSPNQTGGNWLINGNMREIRPDIIIKKDGDIIAILDAKYKNYTEIGKIENFNTGSVSRDDLYQMMTYLYHYGRKDKSLTGLFISPVESNTPPYQLSTSDKHRIGVLGLNIRQFEKNNFNRKDFRDEEIKFITHLKDSLK